MVIPVFVKSSTDQPQQTLPQNKNQAKDLDEEELTERQRKLLELNPHITQISQDVYRVECPFDDETFTGRNLEQLIHREGAYRAKNHVNDKPILHASDLEKDETLLENWKQKDRQGENIRDELPSTKDFKTVYLVNSTNGKSEKFKVEKS